MCVRVVRASFEGCPTPQPGDTEIVLKVEVGETFDLTDVHHRLSWSDEDYARWLDKVLAIMRAVIDPRISSAVEGMSSKKVARRLEAALSEARIRLAS